MPTARAAVPQWAEAQSEGLRNRFMPSRELSDWCQMRHVELFSQGGEHAGRKKALFELTASELQDKLSAMFKPFSGSHPIRCEVGAALLAAEAATQRLALRALDAVSAGGGAADKLARRTRQDI